MYPYDILPGIDLYVIFLCVAVISAMVIYRIMADRLKICAKLQNLCIYTAVAAIVFGYFSAVLFQAVYDIKKNGAFVINLQTGATFYGGLIGGAGMFLLIYFIAGKKIFPQKEHITHFFDVADAAACSITVAHAFGRLGCLMAGCCYGSETNAWYGIKMLEHGEWVKRVPTQLFEAIFLALIFLYLFARIKDKQSYCLQIYMILYGFWRFILEFIRDDYRGSTVIELVTPSQLTAIIMVLGGILLIIIQKKHRDSIAAGVSTISKAVEDEYEYDEEYDYDYTGEKSEDADTKTENEEKTEE